MFDYPKLSQLAAQDKNITEILDDVFQFARTYYPSLSRFSVALLGENKASNYYISDFLHHASNKDCSEHELQAQSALARMSINPEVRIINDLTAMDATERIKKLVQSGHRSSYTSPIPHRGQNLGFIFINAEQIGFFSEQNVECDIAFLTQVVTNLFVQQFENQRHFQSSLSIALNMGHARDPETKEHLTRMGKYSELLARLLSKRKSAITHQFIHRIRIYAPFHDIGKYRIPDRVLFSTEKFSDEDRKVMNNHTIYGEEIINDVVNISKNHAISQEEIQFIKNIVRHHHERFDGEGLPDSLGFSRIPLEARIVTLADVFDALLSKRAYKRAWPLSNVVSYIEQHSGGLFDPDCVQTLISHIDLFLAIRNKYGDQESSQNAIAS
ncbi:HD-GYP domain-containing protein [Vibrio profundi]|uniref:HD-GYP domain-containing protein n=1 Tax=Vibrio profundi TaxID=1774960 RepID=UPI003735DC7B